MQANREKRNINNVKIHDSSSKVIFDDPILCAQFLRDYVDIPILKDIRPEEIEDVSERYVPLIGEERNADTVKRINLYGRMPLYLISLIEHKTEVDYNVSMQIFRYMVYIWEDYEKEMERAYNKGISKTKNFKYPPVLPIVYYEGTAKWTAPFELKDRIFCSDFLQEYIPNYKYQLVGLQDYSNRALLERQDEISLIMLMNKIQSRQDAQLLRDIPPEVFDGILKNTPESLLDMIAKIFRTLLIELNVPEQEMEEMVGKVKVRKMGQLWANADFDDIRRDWQKVKDARKKAEQYKEKADQYMEKADQYKEKADQYKEEADQFKEKADQYKEEADQFKEKADQYKEEADQFKEKADQYKEKVGQYKEKADQYKEEANQYKEEVNRYKEKTKYIQDQSEQFHATWEKSIQNLVMKARSEGKEKREAQQELQEIFMLTEEAAEEKIKLYWEESV